MKKKHFLKKMPVAMRIASIATAVLVGAALMFVLVSAVAAYRPAPCETLRAQLQPAICLRDTISITTWNVGYCGLSAQSDFFYDGGKTVRESAQQVGENLRQVAQFLRSDSSDFTLLQEVDRRSKRSYYADELDSIAAQMPAGTSSVFATNFRALYIPIPLLRPIGRVYAGVATLGRCAPYHAVRYSYPFSASFPASLFELRRCFLVCRYTTSCGRDLVLVNTHNSAYDKGSRRMSEMQMLRDFAVQEYESGSYVIVGGDWNQTPPDYGKAAGTKAYTPLPIDTTLFPQGWQWVYDRNAESMRFTDTAYSAGATQTATVDFFLASPNVSALSVSVHDLQFAHSDHNPVSAKFELKIEN